MQHDPIISWHDMPRSEAVDAIIRKRIAALGRFCPEAIGIRVTLAMPHRRHQTGRGVDVRIHLDLPGPDLDVARSFRLGHAADEVTRAVNAAFSALEDQLKENRRKQGALEVKHHAEVLHGEIVEIEPELGYGFVRADNGREVYFQKDGLVSGDWDRLERGGRLRFREIEGEKGPFAVDVAPVD
jgi:cold shock CspA family protein/ribosome-associated translation inhibitor RaiA